MLKNQTTFIIGAGASSHYFYPTGEELIDLILNFFKTPKNNIVIKLLQDHGIADEKTVWDFCKKLHIFRSSNIDNFLLYNESFERLGRILIATAIFLYESTFLFHRNYMLGQEHSVKEIIIDYNVHKRNFDSYNSEILSCVSKRKKFHGDWLTLLFSQIIENCSTEEEVIDSFKNAKFITFNYDLSLECYLKRLIKDTEWLKSLDKKIYDKNNIVHVFGSIYSDDILDNFPELYGSTWGLIEDSFLRANNLDSKNQLEIIAGKKILSRKKHAELEKARNWIKDSKEIYIMGFGFDDSNCDILELRNLFEMRKDKGFYTIKDSAEFYKKNSKNIYYTEMYNNKKSRYFFDEVLQNKSNHEFNKTRFIKCEKNVYDFFREIVYLR